MFSGGLVGVSYLKKIKFHGMKKSGQNFAISKNDSFVADVVLFVITQF